MIKISSIVVTLLTTASILWDATSRARTGAAQIPGTTLDAHGVASLGTTQGVGHEFKAGRNVGGGRASIQTVGEDQNAVGDATLGIAGSVGQNVGGDTVRVKTAGVGQDAGGGATLGTVNGGEKIAGRGRVRVKTVSVGQGTGGGATIGAVNGGEQIAGRGSVRVRTDGVGQGAGGGATLGAVDDEIVDGGPFHGESEVLATNGSTPLIEAPWRSANVLFTVKTGIKPPPCDSKGFANPTITNRHGCVCNFAGACNKYGIPVSKEVDLHSLEGFAPEGMEAFKYGDTVTICEEATVGILFDCGNHVPLYAATVIDGKNLVGEKSRTGNWKPTKDDYLKKVQTLYVGGDNDYDQSSCMVHCYKDRKSKIFKDWNDDLCTTDHTTIPDVTYIDRGHMISARYGYGNGHEAGVKATFTYTNAVPQMGSFNRGAWNQGEKEVMEFAKDCQERALLEQTTGGKVYVVVGAIPTGFFDEIKFFGEGGFSNFQDDKYRLLLPSIMWTVACCINNDGFYMGKMAFYGRNLKINQPVKYFNSANDMFIHMNTIVKPFEIPYIVVFPGIKDCN